MNRTRRFVARDTKGAAALEFAIVGSVFMMMLLGGLEIGLMMWTKVTLQTVASRTARCAAISASGCTTATTSQVYAVGLAKALLGAGFVNTAGSSPDFTVTVAAVTTCGSGSASGTFQKVTIVASGWVGSMLFPVVAKAQTLTACYPT